METVYKRLIELAELCKEHLTDDMGIIVGDGLKVSYIRKLCEYIFGKGKMKIKVLVQGQGSASSKQKRNKKERIMTVKVQGRSYAELVLKK